MRTARKYRFPENEQFLIMEFSEKSNLTLCTFDKRADALWREPTTSTVSCLAPSIISLAGHSKEGERPVGLVEGRNTEVSTRAWWSCAAGGSPAV